MASLRPIVKAIFEVKKDSRFLRESITPKGIDRLFRQFGKKEEKDCSLRIVYMPKDEFPKEEIRLVKIKGRFFIERT